MSAKIGSSHSFVGHPRSFLSRSHLCSYGLIALSCIFSTACNGEVQPAEPAQSVSKDVLEHSEPVNETMRCDTITYRAPSGPRSDITFEFDEAYRCGQFANGDWWVSEGRRGYVQINNISPRTAKGSSGHQANPTDSSRQAFDARISGYDEALATPLPMRVKGVSSVVKAVSSEALVDGRPHPSCRPCLAYAAVLTITAEPVLNTEEVLRPSYFGETKQFYRMPGTTKMEALQLEASCCSMLKSTSFEWIAKRFAGVQLDHLQGWGGGAMHPSDNMPNYGADIARDNAVALLRLLVDDFDISNDVHRRALINYLQMGVDLKGMALNGVNWPGAGGHGNGRKLPLLFTGWLLGEDGFDRALVTADFSEDQQVYWSDKTKIALFGQKCSDSGYWSQLRTGSGAKDCRDPYGYIDGDGYKFCCISMPWKYAALAVSILGLEHEWNNDAFFAYVHRWVEHGAWSGPDPCAPYNGNPRDYAREYGPDGNGGCIHGVGRHSYPEPAQQTQTTRDAGHYDSRFADEIWTWFQRQNH